MARMIPDSTGRFPERPYYKASDLDRECETIITDFLISLYGEAIYPIKTDDLTKLIERDADSCDQYADLSEFGSDVEGVTLFHSDRGPEVRISETLQNPRYENRLRTTLTHEYGHVRFHSNLWSTRPKGDLLDRNKEAAPTHCKRDTMLNAPKTDWMEWQAGYICGALLMPRKALANAVSVYQDQHGIFGSVEENGPHARAMISIVMSAFQVSEEAARIRLLKLDYFGVEHGPSLFSLPN